MKKRYDLIDLDCANCAAKMDFDKIMKKVVKAIRKVEPDCEVVL